MCNPLVSRQGGRWRSSESRHSIGAPVAALVAAEGGAIPHACVAVHCARFEAWASTHVIESIDALRRVVVGALLTTGPVMTAEALGSVRDNVTVEDFVPQAEVFPHAAAVVCHGDSGTLLGGLAVGLPMVVVPLFADQPYNARAVEAAGAGVAVLQPEAAALRIAIQRVLDDSALRAGAGRIAEEMSSMASMDDAAAALAADLPKASY